MRKMTRLNVWIVHSYLSPQFISIVFPEFSNHGFWTLSPSITSVFWRKCASWIVSRNSNSSHCSDEEAECKSMLFSSVKCPGRESVAYVKVASNQTFGSLKWVAETVPTSWPVCFWHSLCVSLLCRSSTLRSTITRNWQRYAHNRSTSWWTASSELIPSRYLQACPKPIKGATKQKENLGESNSVISTTKLNAAIHRRSFYH